MTGRASGRAGRVGLAGRGCLGLALIGSTLACDFDPRYLGSRDAQGQLDEGQADTGPSGDEVAGHDDSQLDQGGDSGADMGTQGTTGSTSVGQSTDSTQGTSGLESEGGSLDSGSSSDETDAADGDADESSEDADVCMSEGESCSFEPCCAGLECRGDERCQVDDCRDEGERCKNDDSCCDGLECRDDDDDDEVCQPEVCRVEGEKCKADKTCCEGLVCSRGGRCHRPDWTRGFD